MNMEPFTFNEHGVCENPKTVLLKETKEYRAELVVAQAQTGKWCYGYSIHVKFGNMSYSGGPASIHRAEFDTEEDARKTVVNWYAEEIKKDLAAARAYLRNEHSPRNKKPNTKSQPTLF